MSSSSYNPGHGHEKACRLTNTIHSEVAPCLPLPSLPVFCGAVDQKLKLFDEQTSVRSLDRKEILAQASKIADLLRDTDVSYLNLKDGASAMPWGSAHPSTLHNEVLQYNPEAFEYSIPGLIKERNGSTSNFERNPLEHNKQTIILAEGEYGRSPNHHSSSGAVNVDSQVTASLRKGKGKRKGNADVPFPTGPDPVELQDGTIERFCEVLEDLCGRAETLNEDEDEADAQLLSSDDLKMLVNEILSIRAKKILHIVPVDILVRLLNVLDHQIRAAEGLSIDDNEDFDSDALSLVICAMESTHAALAVMTNHDMPKQLYKEEIIDRILDFSRHQIMEIMSACDPSHRAVHKPVENGAVDGEDDDEDDPEFESASKKRRGGRSVKARRSTGNKIPAAVHSILQKLCTILGFLKDLLLIERLSDSFILQLAKTSFAIFLVDNIQILQLKAISLICAIFSSYTHHRNYLMDETVQLLWKLPISKRALRAYYLPDEEQRQIQMITALLIQLVQCSTNIPETLRHNFIGNSILEISIDSSYPTKCNEAAREACIHFWTRILERLTTVKTQDVSEVKVAIENLVTDLLTTLNLPEYPAAAPILEVLCVLLLQNAGLKSKDISIRTLAIDLLGTVAARLKRDSAFCRNDKFWISQELVHADGIDQSYPKDACSVCLDGKSGKTLFICHGCQRAFHTDCMGVTDHDVPTRGWFCQFCLCKKQLFVLQSYCKSQCKDDGKKNHAISESAASESITKVEIVQQMLLDYLQENGSADDTNLYARWFHLCLWYKDDPRSQEKFFYYLSRLKSKAIVQDFGTVSSLLKRESARRISLILGTNSSFSRGFDKILCLLLVSLRESSSILRAKALRAVSIIVEADPEVLCDERVKTAVEGRFCDSAISAREAALELVGRHIASHPDVGLTYFEKVAERVKDTGVSVRKRAIKIIRDMCTSNPDFSEFTNACIEIISRVSDEESSIQDLVCRTFYEFWFEEPTESQTQFVGDGSSVPLEVAKKTEQVVEMLRKMPNHQLLVTVIRHSLALDFFPQSAKAAGINPVLVASVRKRCELMCKCLLERILQVEETDNEGVEVEVRTLPYVQVLHAFCVVDPTLCAPASDPSQFVVTLQPYLKSQGDSGAVAKLLESIIFVIDVVLALLRKLPQSVVEDLEHDLKQMIVRHSYMSVVRACIKCLCSLSKVAGKGATSLENLIVLFIKRLEIIKVDNNQLVGRSLFCLGILIRYGKDLIMTSDNKDVHVDKSLRLIKTYLGSQDFVIKVRSLQALGFVLIARPDYMLERDIRKILQATLSPGSDSRLKMQSLQNIYEYLHDAESQMGTDNVDSTAPQHPEDGGRSVPVAAGAGDTNICGGILQLYWDAILERCLDMNEQVRQAALKIVEVALRQGLVHPITCVPYLIALETDPQDANSKLAHHLLTNMNEKYPSFFESRLGDGLQLSFSFIQDMTRRSLEHSTQNKVTGNTKGKSDVSSSAHARLGVSRIYRLIRGNRISRNKFMSSVVRKFDPSSLKQSLIPFLVYCSEILASLPFSLPDEPLYLIYIINRVIQVRAGSLEATMKALSSRSLEGNSHMVPSENGVIQPESTLENSSNTMVNGGANSMTLADQHGISKDDLQQIQAYCHAAMALQLLLKLKRHLKIVYNLNDARCQAYSPTEPLKPGEVLGKQSIPFIIGDTNVSLPTSYKEVIERYQEFKTALREDAVDYAIYSANIKRKRPPPKSASKGGKTGRETHAAYYDEDEDEDYTDGNPSVGGSGGGRRSGRVRQRL